MLISGLKGLNEPAANLDSHVYLLISSTAKSYNFPKLSEAWVIFQGSNPDIKQKSIL